jgi:hypothetical protein
MDSKIPLPYPSEWFDQAGTWIAPSAKTEIYHCHRHGDVEDVVVFHPDTPDEISLCTKCIFEFFSFKIGTVQKKD